MNRIFSLILGTVLLTGLPASGQQTTASTTPVTDRSGVPTVKAQMNLLKTGLDLSDDQQTRLLPILEDLHQATVQAVHDESTPAHERLEKLHTARLTADRRMRAMLTDEQRTRLDQIEHEPHPELHGTVDQTLRAQP